MNTYNKQLAEYIDEYIRNSHVKSRTALRVRLMKAVGLLSGNKKLTNPVGQWRQFLNKRMWLEQFQSICKELNIVIMITPFDITLYKGISKGGVGKEEEKKME